MISVPLSDSVTLPSTRNNLLPREKMNDRTEEFYGAVNVFKSTIIAPAVGNATTPATRLGSHECSSLPRPVLDPPETSEFFKMAENVGVGFRETSRLIERMRKLVRRKGFSNNPAAEINEVMTIFEGDMAELQKDIATLQMYADGQMRGSPPPKSQRQKHCQNIVDTLRNNAQEHTKAFRDALLLRAAVEKQQNERQRIFSHSRGVAPATQLDYPLFGAVGTTNAVGLRNRAMRRPASDPSQPQRAVPPPAPPRGGEGGRPPPPAFGDRNRGVADKPGAGNAIPQPPLETGRNSAHFVGKGGIGRRHPQGTVASQGPPSTDALADLGGNANLLDEHTTGSSGPTSYSHPRNGIPAAIRDPFGSGGCGEYGQGNGHGRMAGAQYSGGSYLPLPPTEPFRGGTGAFGLRKRQTQEDGREAEEEARRAAWQLQVQDEAKSRVEDSHKVEKMITELGQMFTRFSSMVAAQEEVVLRIEDDVEAAHAFAEEGQANLAKYYQVMSGNRGIIIKVFIILIVFIWVFLGLMK